MRVICLDVGEKRIGVAVTDALDLTAQGVETIWTKGFERDCARVVELCRQYDTDRVLCGLPKNMDGSEGFQAQRVRAFAERLAREGLNVRFEDERLTTKLATGVLLEADMRRGKRKEVVDKLAATYILQSFLDKGGWRDESNNKIYLRSVYHMSENNHEFDMEREDIVQLVDEDGEAFRTEIGSESSYFFDAVMPGRYQILYTLPEDAVFAEKTAGGNVIASDENNQIITG